MPFEFRIMNYFKTKIEKIVDNFLLLHNKNTSKNLIIAEIKYKIMLKLICWRTNEYE